MHEMSLAGGILKLVDDAAARDPFARVQRLHLQAGSGRGGAGRGVGERHAEHIAQRQRETAPAAGAMTLAGDHAGENRHHRQAAGRERQQQSGTEECRQHREQIAAADEIGLGVLLRDEALAGSRGR